MEQRLSVVTLAAEDLERSAAFYRSLGWDVGFRNDEVAFFQLNGIVLGLYRQDRFAAELGVEPETLRPGGTALAHNVRTKGEVQKVMDQARAAGARVFVEPHDAEWGGRSGYFADVDGHLWEVAWNPAWPIDGEGRVTLG